MGRLKASFNEARASAPPPAVWVFVPQCASTGTGFETGVLEKTKAPGHHKLLDSNNIFPTPFKDGGLEILKRNNCSR